MWIKPEDYKIVGEAMAAARKKAGVSQDALAVLLEKPQSFISTYERGQRRIDLLEFLRIIEIIKADPNEVFAAIVDRRRGSN